MSRTSRLSLFEGYGIELEYMIVDRQTLQIRPIADQVLEKLGGQLMLEVDLGPVAWSNELALHIVELKCNGPQKDLLTMRRRFASEIERVNHLLKPMNAMLMPSAMHPFMDPDTEMRLWPHENTDIYQTYNAIFDCRGHGWTNLQSTHINLPFANDDEFGRLHAAIRLVLPILPGLAASSPIYGGKITGRQDNRLDFYRYNQRKVPMVAGHVIPERVFTRKAYEEELLQKIYKDIAPFDPSGILQEEWLNSRGAIARFDRDAIEIRVLDIQESPKADMAVVAAVISLVKAMAEERWCDVKTQMKADEKDLARIFSSLLDHGDKTLIQDEAFLSYFGIKSAVTVREFWREKMSELAGDNRYPIQDFYTDFMLMNQRGSLASEIVNSLHGDTSAARIRESYRRLCECLEAGEIFYA